MAQGFPVHHKFRREGSPTVVFRALSTPERLERGFLSDAEIDPRKGGRFRIRWIGRYARDGELRRFARGRSITLHWSDALRTARTVRTEAAVQVAANGPTPTLTRVRSEFRQPEHFAECSSRWAYYLMDLTSAVDHRTGLRSKGDR